MFQNLGAGSILGARNMTCRVHAEDPQISGVILQVVIAMAIWVPGFCAFLALQYTLRSLVFYNILIFPVRFS